MPVYEYECQECRKSFDILRKMSEMNAVAKCPKCGSEKTKRQMSVFGVKSSGEGSGCQITGKTPPPSCGRG